MRRPFIATVLGVAALSAACQNDLVEMCSPTAIEIEVEGGDVDVTLRSGDRPIRNKTLRVEARGAGDGPLIAREIETPGNGQIEFSATALPADTTTLVVGFAGDDAYCASSNRTEIAMDAPDHSAR